MPSLRVASCQGNTSLVRRQEKILFFAEISLGHGKFDCNGSLAMKLAGRGVQCSLPRRTVSCEEGQRVGSLQVCPQCGLITLKGSLLSAACCPFCAHFQTSPNLPWRGDGHWGKKEKKKNNSWYSSQGPDRMAQTPQARTGDSGSQFRHSRCSTLFNYNSYFLVGGQWYFQLLFMT